MTQFPQQPLVQENGLIILIVNFTYPIRFIFNFVNQQRWNLSYNPPTPQKEQKADQINELGSLEK